MSASGGVPVKAEDAGELVLDGGGVGEHAVGPGPAPDAGVEQDGLADAGQFAGQSAGRQVQSGPGGAAAHEVGELEGEHAGDDVDDDVVLGPVEHRAEGGGAGVFHLPEGGFGLGLGPVGGDDLGGGPVVVAYLCALDPSLSPDERTLAKGEAAGDPEQWQKYLAALRAQHQAQGTVSGQFPRDPDFLPRQSLSGEVRGLCACQKIGTADAVRCRHPDNRKPTRK